MRYDVIVIGGSYAGLAAALQLGRARRRVLVVDGGSRRNDAAEAAHGYLTRDGENPAALVASGRREIARYPTVRIVDDMVKSVVAHDNGFLATAAGEGEIGARAVVLATGLVDELPPIPGLRERWGRSVVPCPYCHAYESSGGRLAVIGARDVSVHMAALTPDWGRTTYFTQGTFEPEGEMKALLAKRGVTIERTRVDAFLGAAPRLEAIRLADGRTVPIDLAFLVPPTRMASPIAAQLGCAFDDEVTGPVVRTDHLRQTTVPRVFAAGDMCLPAASIALATSTGSVAGIGAHQSLIFDEV